MRAHSEETDITFPLLIDVDRAAYRAAELKSANLLHLLVATTLSRRNAPPPLAPPHKLGENPFQLGASFIFVPAMWTASATSAKHSATMLAVADVLSALSR